jgi:hypothetical protein
LCFFYKNCQKYNNTIFDQIYVSKIIFCFQFVYFHVWENNIGDVGCESLAEGLQYVPNLKSLYLLCNYYLVLYFIIIVFCCFKFTLLKTYKKIKSQQKKRTINCFFLNWYIHKTHQVFFCFKQKILLKKIQLCLPDDHLKIGQKMISKLFCPKTKNSGKHTQNLTIFSQKTFFWGGRRREGEGSKIIKCRFSQVSFNMIRVWMFLIVKRISIFFSFDIIICELF